MTGPLWNQISYTKVYAYLNSAWVDITAYVLVDGLGGPITGSIGRATELNQTDPTVLSFVLKNNDGRFTPDNTAGAYYPYWKTGVKIRWAETIGAKTFTFPDMWVEIPEVALSFEVQGSPTLSDRVLRVNCIDRKTKLDRAPQFVSMLSEHILYAGSSDLVAFWPLGEAAGSRIVQPRVQPSGQDLRMRPRVAADSTGPTTGPSGRPGTIDSLVTFGSNDLLMDDLGTVLFTLDEASNFAVLETAQPGFTMTFTAGFSMAMWINFTSLVTGTFFRLTAYAPPVATFVYATLNYDTTTGFGALFRSGQFGPINGTITSGFQAVIGEWNLVTLTSDMAGNATLYINGVSSAVTGIGSGVSVNFTDAYIAGDIPSYRARAQVYNTCRTQAQHLAQYRMAIDGLYNQTVDTRIRTICNYAGITDAELDLEESDSVMPHATFAGQRPGTLVSAAAETGGGIVFTRESDLVYQDRKHRFDL